MTPPEEQIFQPYQSKRAYQEIAQDIHRAIMAGGLHSGERLPSERLLAEQFQVGRLTIREALRTLETKGLIQIKHGRGGGSYVGVPEPMVLPSMIIDNLQLEGLTSEQATETRVGLECTIVKSAIKHATKEDLELVEENVEGSRDIMGDTDAKKVVSTMIDYHILVGETTHNAALIMFIRAVMEWARRGLIDWIPSPEVQSKSYRDHLKILKSIRNKDIGLAQKHMEAHVTRMSGYVTNGA
jgi:GntR family transcriptional repressor for pyruvate dehydrogenase complex